MEKPGVPIHELNLDGSDVKLAAEDSARLEEELRQKIVNATDDMQRRNLEDQLKDAQDTTDSLLGNSKQKAA